MSTASCRCYGMRVRTGTYQRPPRTIGRRNTWRTCVGRSFCRCWVSRRRMPNGRCANWRWIRSNACVLPVPSKSATACLSNPRCYSSLRRSGQSPNMSWRTDVRRPRRRVRRWQAQHAQRNRSPLWRCTVRCPERARTLKHCGRSCGATSTRSGRSNQRARTYGQRCAPIPASRANSCRAMRVSSTTLMLSMLRFSVSRVARPNAWTRSSAKCWRWCGS